MVPLCRLISASCGLAPPSSTASGSSSSQIGSSAGKYRRFSSNRSNTEVIHRSPNQTRGRTPCCFSSSGRVSVACSNSVIRVSCHSCLPNRNGEFAAERHLDAGDGLGGVPVAGERVRAHLDVQLDAGARGLGRDAVGVGEQLLGAVDLDPHVLAAGREDLLVQHLVALVRRQGALVHVLLGQRGQDADHDQVAADAAGLGVGGVQVGPDLVFQPVERVAAEQPGRHVDLQVELADLGGPGRVRDHVEHLGVAHRRHAVGVHQVQLDLLAHHGAVLVERPLAEHAGEHVQRAPHLLAVLAPVLAADLDRLDVTAHEVPAQLDEQPTTTFPRDRPHASGARADR